MKLSDWRKPNDSDYVPIWAINEIKHEDTIVRVNEETRMIIAFISKTKYGWSYDVLIHTFTDRDDSITGGLSDFEDIKNHVNMILSEYGIQ